MSPTLPASGALRRLRVLLAAASLLTVLNLLLTASIISVICGLLILVMSWGVYRGDHPLSKGLGWFLTLYGGVNLIVLCVIVFYGTQARRSALVWMGCYSVAVLVLGCLLRSKHFQENLKSTPPPQNKTSRFHFFHGGWRDL